MEEQLDVELGQLSGLTMAQLRERYRERFPDEFGTTHRQYLIRRIAWRLQAAVYGGLTEAALRRAMEIADETELKGRSPSSLAEVAKGNVAIKKQPRKRRDVRLPPLGTELTRIYRDRTVTAIVVTNGFLYEGQTYRSLSAIARAATGTRWNGLLFFRRAQRKPRGSARIGSEPTPGQSHELVGANGDVSAGKVTKPRGGTDR